MLDIIVGESPQRTAALGSDELDTFDISTLFLPITGESDDKPVAVVQEDLFLPVVGEDDDDDDLFWMEFPVVGEVEGEEFPSSPDGSGEGSTVACEQVPGPTAPGLAVGKVVPIVEDVALVEACDFQLPVVGEADEDSAAPTQNSTDAEGSDSEDEGSHSIIANPVLDVTPSPCMLDGILPGLTFATPSQDATPSPPLSPYSEGNEERSPSTYHIDARMPGHQRLAYFRDKRDAISATLEALQDGQSMARTLQDSPFPTSPNFWRVYQNSLIRRWAGVDDLWEDLQ